MDKNAIMTFFSQLSLSHWLLVVFLPGATGFFVYFWKYLKAQFRFGRNLKRNVYFLKTSEAKKLSVEKNTLAQLKLFNLDPEIKDIAENLKELQLFKKQAVYIVGYDAKYDKYKELFDRARPANIPILILANPGEITSREHWNIFNGYIYCDVANSANRTGIILMGMMQIVPRHMGR
ncbi:MAG: hypothetical protein GY737_30020 [Desulfobacteraceae bacterium]|nr:hypothetical protein [Desulfobacteraceae bacterium]